MTRFHRLAQRRPDTVPGRGLGFDMDWDSFSDKSKTALEGVGRGMMRLFGSRNERIIRRLVPTIQRIGALEKWTSGLDQEGMRSKVRELREGIRDGKTTLDGALPEVFALVREASRAHARLAALRRPARRRVRAALAARRRQGLRRRDDDGRGQDPRRDSAAVPQRALRSQGCLPRHGQRLPGAARRELDAADLRLPGPHRRARSSRR